MTEIINKYKKHIQFICALVLLQFFVTDIFSAIYLPTIKAKLKTNIEGKLYEKGQYRPISILEEYRDYEFVFVNNWDRINTTVETYYTKKGEEISVTYRGGKLVRTSSYSPANYYIIAFPITGFILFMASIIHKMVRTHSITTWGLMKQPDDKFEQLTKLYGIPLYVCSILFGLLGRY